MRILKLTLFILFLYLCIAAYLFVIQRSLIYFPLPPSNHGYPEEVFQFENAHVHVIVVNPDHDKAILYFGGNAEAVENSAPFFINHFPNHTVYLVQYRGYGHSTGEPTQANLSTDSLVIFDRIKPRHKAISVIGRSLGSGIATQLAANKHVNKLILITPFDSLQSLAQTRFPFFPMSILLQDKYNSLGHAKKIKAPTLLLVAEQDQLIPFSHSQKLALSFTATQAITTLIPDRNHNNISYSPLYITHLKQFINEQ